MAQLYNDTTIRLTMIYRFLPLILLFIFSFKPLNNIEQIKQKGISTDPELIAANAKTSFITKCKSVYSIIDANGYSLPSFESFLAAFEGYENLRLQGKLDSEILTIIDFSLSSVHERMWVVDMKTQKVLLRSLVSHGKNSGLEFATNFSNENESYKSSLGFYVTGESYNGKHGLSLRLDGMEFGINHNARARAVVIHGADYVSKSFIKNHGRLGRSQGCPAVPYEVHKELIETIKGKSCVFIYHPTSAYVSKSKLVS